MTGRTSPWSRTNAAESLGLPQIYAPSKPNSIEPPWYGHKPAALGRETTVALRDFLTGKRELICAATGCGISPAAGRRVAAAAIV